MDGLVKPGHDEGEYEADGNDKKKRRAHFSGGATAASG